MTEPSQYFKGRTVQEQMNEVIGYVDVRSAEVATDAIAADVAQVHQDMLDADADATAAAASAAAAAGTLTNAVKKTGEASQSIAGDISVSGVLTGGTVTVPAPVNNTDAASKKYVDDQDALDVKLTGAQNITGAKTVPLEATGTFSNQIASSSKVKNELDNYTPMVRTTGNQNISGIKTVDQLVTINNLPTARSSTTTGKWKEIVHWDNVTGNWHAIFEVFGPLDSKYAIGFFDMASNFHSIKIVGKVNLDPADLALNYSADGSTCRLMIKTASNQVNFFVKYSTNTNTFTNLPIVDGAEYASSADFPEANTVYGSLRVWDAS